jgi:folylpolyglutamate synthase/dihydropteroate synthase
LKVQGNQPNAIAPAPAKSKPSEAAKTQGPQPSTQGWAAKGSSAVQRATQSSAPVVTNNVPKAGLRSAAFEGQLDRETQSRNVSGNKVEMLFDGVNSSRSANGVTTLTRSHNLDRIAQAQARDMALRNYFAHSTPEGIMPWDRVDLAGLKVVALADAQGLAELLQDQDCVLSVGGRVEESLPEVYAEAAETVVAGSLYLVGAVRSFVLRGGLTGLRPAPATE